MLSSIRQLWAQGGSGAISEEEEIRRIEALLDNLCPGNPVNKPARQVAPAAGAAAPAHLP